MSHPARCASGVFVRRVSSILCLLLVLPLPARPARAFAASAVKDSAPAVPAASAEKAEPVTPVKPAARARASAAAALQNPQTPFHGTPINVPGIIQVEDFDNGGEGVAYHDTTTGNSGDNTSYRAATDVDINGSTMVNSTQAGEWLEYTINVSTTDNYRILAEYGSYFEGGTFHVEVDGVDKTGALTVTTTGSEWFMRSLSGPPVQLTAGQHVLRLAFDTNNADCSCLGQFNTIRVVSATTAQTPFNSSPFAIPGTIKLAEFDNGGEGIAYHDHTAGNSSENPPSRQTDVDADSNVAVGNIQAGEWLEYTVNVAATSSTYAVVVEVGSYFQGGTFHVESDGVDVTGPMTVPPTNSDYISGSVTKTGVTLTAGQHVLRLAFDSNNTGSYGLGRFMSMRVVEQSTAQTSYNGTPFAVPGTIPMDQFDNGGEGVAYHDHTAGNSSENPPARQTDVDLSGNVVVHVQAGEWLEYTVNVASTGNYTLVTQVGSYFPGGTFHVEVDGVNRTGTQTIPSTTSDWYWGTVVQPGVSLTAGQHILRVMMDSNSETCLCVGQFKSMRLVNESTAQTPYNGTPFAVPGVIQVEEFDNGGEQVAYRDLTAGNSSGNQSSRQTDVDVDGGVLIDTQAGEWLEYTINVATAGNYKITARVGSYFSGGTFHFDVDGVNVTGAMTVPGTGSGWYFRDVTKTGVPLSAGQHVLRLAFDSNNTGCYCNGQFDSIRITQSGSTLPYPWDDDDVGNVGVVGSASYANSVFTVKGSGTDIWGGEDAFHYVHQTLYGDGEIVARVTGMQNTAPWAKAGVMIRESLSPSSSHVMMLVSAQNGLAFQRRIQTGGQSTHTPGPAAAAPYWVKLVRSGHTFSAYASADGTTWTLVGTDTITMASSVRIGLAVSSHNNSVLNTSTFDHVSVVSNAPMPANGRIVFRRQEGSTNVIYSMKPDGTELARLAEGEAPTWSPDGTRIAYMGINNGLPSIYVMTADGYNQTPLTSGAMDEFPSWSPDGSRIVFSRWVSNGGLLHRQLFVVNADGTNLQQITSNPHNHDDPAWSPDGTKIAFSSDRPNSTPHPDSDLYVVNADGSGEVRLTQTPTQNEYHPSWSPSGAKLAFDCSFGIEVMNADGTGRAALAAPGVHPEWSPDATKFTYYNFVSNDFEIFVMNANGSGQTQITSAGGYDVVPDWGVAVSLPTPTPTPTPEPNPTPLPIPTVGGTIVADVVAIDQVFFYNRLGAVNPAGMIYALRRDVVPINPSEGLVPGNVRLRDGKRPRPIVLRVNSGQKLQINFQNLLDPDRADDNQPATRTAGVHVAGLQLVDGIASDGSNVGQNTSSLVPPGGTKTYTLYAEREGNHLMYSTAATTGGEGDGGSLAMGLFGSVNVEASGAEWYRSQVTRQEMEYATAGRTPGNQPIINYDAVYPAGHPRAGQPVLRMLMGNEIVHSDLNAIITGPNKGRFPAGTYRPNATEPDRNQPFREFTVVYHDEIKAIQAFPIFEDPVFEHTLHSVRDAFAINYGTGGIGAEILANRFQVGPMANCTECLYEEFFLSTWAVADPAMIVDRPANETDQNGNLITGLKATKAFFPEDPSNVHHSYINDHVKFRVVHAGPKEHHIHHLHAHQWLNTPDDDNSTYLDSQALGPGYAFTTEIVHGGSGNRNKVVGDSIFHCHFYPHFAMGMWELWRSHDVFEEGTPLDGAGRPVAGQRALPDGEIMAGTPIPGLVPLPTIAMPPMPQAQVSIVNGQVNVNGAGNPGFPFFVPGVAGHRPPHPPLDTVDDGGLPRHVIVGGTFEEHHTRHDFNKELLTADARAVPETGTPTEVAAMNFHAARQHPSFRPDGTPGNFITNGLPPRPGAPYSDPCIDDAGNAVGVPRIYKGANIQLDMKFNKAGWHFPQQRILTLWGDVAPTLAGQRPPEPFFFRANTNDCITFHHTNLVPRVYQLDDFQVKTPTDIMGQHIHLVKFDVTASDGAGNGFNYEDGSFSPEEVVERIAAINAFGGLRKFNSNDRFSLTAKPHPFFGTLGAQTTIQRWFADDVLNNLGQDRTLRTVFTHDHFGPSTHQQAGLYAGLIIEPLGSVWRHPETGQLFGGRFDGGPTSWRADILTANPADSYREFLLEFADFQMAYKAGGGVNGQGQPVPDPPNAINPPAKNEPGLPFLVEPAEQCPGGVPLPCPEAIAAADIGTMVVNYRNEPVPLRVVNDPNVSNPTQAAGAAGDLSNVYRSDITRAFAPMNVQPNFYPPLTGGIFDRDPFTPLLRAYEDDRVQIRVLVGAHEEGHNFGVHGVKWRFEPGTDWNPAIPNNTGFRNNQMMGISEHFEFIIPTLPKSSVGSFADYLYQPGVAVDDQWNGLWGILRAYNRTQPDLFPLPNNPDGHGPVISNVGDFNGVCPKAAAVREYDVSAVTAQNALDGGTLVYNPRPQVGGQLHDPTAILFVRTSDLDANGKLIAGRPIEPLVLRANAGDCVEVTLRNRLPAVPPDLDGFNTLPMIINRFNANQVRPSAQVGLHPQLFFFDVTRSNGVNVGFNPVQTAQPGHTVKYRWYAGDLNIAANGFASANPIEFGATNLSSSDPIKHSNKGAVGAFIIEPLGSSWVEDANSRAQATVTHSGGVFREFVLVHQNDINLRFGGRFDAQGNTAAVPNLAEAEDAEDSGQKAFNYRTEPLWKRLGFEPDTPLEQTREFDFTNSLSNSQVGGDPITPIFTAAAGTPIRFRLLMPGGHARNSVFNLHGHIWEQEPFMFNSTVIGTNPLSEWKGMQFGIGAGSHFDILPKYGAGGRFAVTGDYLYRNQMSFMFDGGMWGLFRVSQ